MKFLSPERRFFFAPMSGITDQSVRRLYAELGADVVVTELISAESIVNGQKKTQTMLNLKNDLHPIGLQIFGGDPHKLNVAAKLACVQQPDFIDLNLGCPMPKVTKKASGSALLRDTKKLKEILTILNDGLEIPLSIKIRTGWCEDSRNALENIQAAYDAKVEFVSIHGRSRALGYTGLSDWAYIKDVCQNSPLPIIGNGDVLSAKDALTKLKETNCFGIMIGRGALLNPFIFLEIKKELGHDIIIPKITEVITRYDQISNEYLDPKIRNIKRAKLYDWFAMRYAGYEKFRSKIYLLKQDDQAFTDLVHNFFKSAELKINQKAENFLMGGHG